VSDPADQQDPLPEGSFFYRRIFTYVVTLLLLAILGWIVWGLTDALAEIVKGDADATATVEVLRDIAFYSICFAAWLATTYVIAPSGEQVVKMVQSAKIAVANKIPGFPGRSPPPPETAAADEDFAPRSRRR
jgi:hypothetical protein